VCPSKGLRKKVQGMKRSPNLRGHWNQLREESGSPGGVFLPILMGIRDLLFHSAGYASANSHPREHVPSPAAAALSTNRLLSPVPSPVASPVMLVSLHWHRHLPFSDMQSSSTLHSTHVPSTELGSAGSQGQSTKMHPSPLPRTR
jgi:hypothetical protein